MVGDIVVGVVDAAPVGTVLERPHAALEREVGGNDVGGPTDVGRQVDMFDVVRTGVLGRTAVQAALRRTFRSVFSAEVQQVAETRDHFHPRT